MDRKAAKELLHIQGWLADEVNRQLTWLTLSRDLPQWKRSLEVLFADAELALTNETE